MKRAFALLCLSLFLLSPVVGQDKKKGKTPPAPSPEEMAAAMQKYGQPGEHHKLLAKYAGKWKHTDKMWMDPSQPPMTSEGTTEFRLIMGGRYLIQEYSGAFMGQPFNGMAITGYDNFREEFKSVWMDDVGTGMMTMTGKFDPATSTLIQTGKMDDPTTNQKDKPFKMTDRWVNDDTIVSEIFEAPSGKNLTKVMEITYTRIK
jgi:hypothetical protein